MINPLTETIKIVKYREELAKSIADMWNESRDSWGGDSAIMSEEQVLEKEANSEDLFLYLALDGEKVVGYCGISEYKEDIEALYIRLLNVHPDYHGKKIGKQLVLKAVEKTIELGWPRIDLYTWPGNVKAVPLYKKCGFFWEDRDDTTHLMNFIPLVLQNEITKPLFHSIDWYEDNVRAIEVKPDGIKENGFTYYEYVWENEQHFLRVQIEKSGRGIRLIETNDIKIELLMGQHTQIEGRESNLQLQIENKRIDSLNVTVEGCKNERTHVQGKITEAIKQNKIFEFPVHIKNGEEPNEWITHPKAEVQIVINGRKSKLAVGVFPKKAMKVKPVYIPKKFDTNKQQYCYIEIDNFLKNEAEISIKLSPNALVQWEKSTYSSKITETGMIKIPFQIKKYGFVQSECTVTVHTANEIFEWKETLAFSMPYFGVKDGGFDQEFFYLQNGFYTVNIRKRDNAISFGDEQKFNQRTFLFPPKFGKPYIAELPKKQASSYEWNYTETSAIMKIHYEIEKPFKQNVALCFELFGEGLLNFWLEIENVSESIVENLYIYQPIRHELNQTYLPLNNEIVYFNDSKMTDLSQLNSKDVTSNWIFSDDKKDPHGIIWDRQMKIGFDGWVLYLEENIRKITKNEIRKSKIIRFSLGVIKTVEEFQLFANDTSKQTVVDEVEIRTKTRNPIISTNKVELILKRSQNRYFNGVLSFLNNDEPLKNISIEQVNNDAFKFIYQTKDDPFVSLQYVLENESQTIQGSSLLLRKANRPIQSRKIDGNGQYIYEIENGDLQFKAAPGFFPTLYSICFQGREWLDSSFPTPEPKAWWNPWTGGFSSHLSGISLFSYIKESSQTSFVKKQDQYKNEWEGLAIETVIEHHEKWKGLKITQYFLTIPGVPMIAHYTELEHRNRTINQFVYTDMFLKNISMKNTSVHLHNKGGSTKFNAGFEEHIFRLNNPSTFSDNDQSQHLQLVSSKDLLDSECIFSEDFALVSTMEFVRNSPGHSKKTDPIFMLFPHLPIDKDMIKNLKSIKF
ncbi:GNAT family N-acetyltransferase [Heyndrickxia vini]|uniref:GNAT family N-acetyltransferase n=1 Tax=Heyndrickxia vini TaxID=1476025 RepID=A0ABX7E680_9BACI|nr:GNAT family N-acetyltransferase [Heyndrickxia vini]QQZ11091.1 GNAT family N-acetyltransferase [Heyndrickxia vini]